MEEFGGLFNNLAKATALEKRGYKTSESSLRAAGALDQAEEIRKLAANENKENATGTAAINAGASAIGGILTSRAQLKAQERQLAQSKARNRVSIEDSKAQLQNSTLQNLAANLANTIIGGS